MIIHKLTTIERKTFYLETGRNTIDGLFQTMSQTLILLIAIQFFNVNDLWKTIISAAPFIGYIAALFIPLILSHFSMTPPKIAGVITLVAGIFTLIAGVSPSVLGYSLSVSFMLILFNIRMPLFTLIYEKNYNISRRATLFSFGVLLGLITSLASNYLSGKALEINLESFRWQYIVFGVLFILSAILVFKIPYASVKKQEGKDKSKNPLRLLRLMFDYPIFGYVLLAWFFAGFANLWCLPLRVVYLAESERGLGLSPEKVIFIIGILPAVTKLIFNFVWARVFDRVNFILLRIFLNFFLMLGILCFFITDNIIIIALGSILMNICFAGTPFIWNLWVTRVAPPGRSGDFMAVHTFLTGVRGVLGPVIGFWFLKGHEIIQVGVVSAILIAISILMLIPIIPMAKVKKKESVQ